MPGSVWNRWHWIKGGLLILVSAIMRVAWLCPLFKLILNNPLVVPQGTPYPAWLILGLLLTASAWMRASQNLSRGSLFSAIGGLAAVLITLAYLFRTGITSLSQWGVNLAVSLADFSEGVPATLVAVVMTVTLWRGGLTINWKDHYGLWRSFVAGTITLSLLMLLPKRMAGNLAPLNLSALTVTFALSGLVALALLSVIETVAIERARGGEAVPLNRYWLMAVGTVVLAILLLGWTLGQILSPDAVAQVLHALKPIADFIGYVLGLILMVIAYLVVLLLTPLLNALNRGIEQPTPQPLDIQRDFAERFGEQPAAVQGLPPALRTILVALFVASIFGGVTLIFLRAWRRRCPAEGESNIVVEEREYIWSLGLLRDQLRSLLQHEPHPEEVPPFLALPHPDDTRQAIRLLYQHLLAEAKALGYPRLPDLTPLAYQGVLESILPTERTALHTLTEAYLLARYSPEAPTSAQLTDARRAWSRIERTLEIRPKTLQLENGTTGRISLGQGRHK